MSRWASNQSRSVATVQEQGDTRDDEATRVAICCHLERAEELLPVQVEVHGRVNGARGVRLGLVRRNPGQIAIGQLDDFASLATNLADLLPFESATLQEEAFNLDRATRVKLALLECRDKFQLIDSDLVDSSRLLPEGVQESLRVEQI